MDLAFVMDQSSTIGSQNFNIMKNFVSRAVDHFKIGSEDTHVAVLSYGTESKIEFNFNDKLFSNVDVKNAVGEIGYFGGGSRLDSALSLADSKIFSKSEGMRNVFKVSHLAISNLSFI